MEIEKGMDAANKFVRAVLELGQNTVLASVLMSFGVSAKLTPSLLTSVSTWDRIGSASLVLGVGWALLTLAWYGHSVVAAFSGRKRAWIFELSSFALGCFLVMGIITVTTTWAANAAAMRYCTGKPDAQYAETCTSAFDIP